MTDESMTLNLGTNLSLDSNLRDYGVTVEMLGNVISRNRRTYLHPDDAKKVIVMLHMLADTMLNQNTA